jgi:ATP-dependent Clp protease ATP-binding subunit ClpC
VSEPKSCRVFFVTHADGRQSGILLRRWDGRFEKPAPAAYGRTEEEILGQLELALREIHALEGGLDRYLWEETFTVHRADLSVYPQTTLKRQSVVGKKRIPLRLTYVACRLPSGPYRVVLPRFGWWLLLESLDVAEETLRNAVSAALLGEDPRWLYDFRREGDEYIRSFLPSFLTREKREAAAATTKAQELTEQFPVVTSVAEEWVERAARHKLAPVYGDDPGLHEVEEALRRFPPPSLLLCGPAGAGKSTFVRRLAALFSRWKRARAPHPVPRIWRTSGERIVAGMVYLGMWQDRCFRIVEELSSEGDLLYVDHLSSIVMPQPDGASIGDLLAPALAAEEISLLAECTEAELEHALRRYPGLVRHFTIVRIPAATAQGMPALLAPHLAKRCKRVTFVGESLRRAVHHLDRFERSTQFPGKGFRFIDWLAKRIEEPAPSGAPGERTLHPADVDRHFSRFSGLPVELIADEVALPPARIAALLGERVVGQGEACAACARVLARFKARLNDPDRPLGTLLFVGPTGVGKTELAKQTARFLFGDESRLVRLDMSEYLYPGSATRLLETGAGSNSLAERVRQQPLSLVLFDEIEKAHPQVFDLLLGVIGEGRLTDRLGRPVDFRMTLVLMTSNLGTSATAPIGFDRAPRESFLREVRRHFRPEFFNRLDEIVAFDPLAPSELRRIVDLLLREAASRVGLVRRGVKLRASEGARQRLAELGHHPTRGARPLKRVIEERVVTPLATRLAADPALADRIVAIVVEGERALDELPADQRADAIVLPRARPERLDAL